MTSPPALSCGGERGLVICDSMVFACTASVSKPPSPLAGEGRGEGVGEGWHHVALDRICHANVIWQTNPTTKAMVRIQGMRKVYTAQWTIRAQK